MKIRHIVTGVVIAGAAAAGTVFGLKAYFRSMKQPVTVTAVSNVYDPWTASSISATHMGNIVSRDSQRVMLQDNQVVSEVYVTVGDKVKVGDPLLAYDTTLASLQKEMQELTIQILELNLKTQEKDLATLRSGKLPGSAGVSSDEAAMTGSSIIPIEDDPGSAADVIVPDPGSLDDSGSADSGADLSGEDQTIGNAPAIMDDFDDAGLPGISDSDNGMLIISGDLIDEDDGSEGLDPGISDETPIADGDYGDEEDLLTPGSGIYSDVWGTDGESRTAAEDFISTVLLMRKQSDRGIRGSYISSALSIFEDSLALTHTENFFDDTFLHENVSVDVYSLREDVMSNPYITEDTQNYLRQALAWVLLFDFADRMDELSQAIPDGKALGELTPEELEALAPQIRAAAMAWHRYNLNLQENAYDPKMAEAVGYLTEEFKREYIDPDTGDSKELSRMDLLKMLSDPLNVSQMIETPDTEPWWDMEPESDILPFDDGLDDGLPDDGTAAAETPVDLSEEIFNQEMLIRETRLLLREAELKLSQQQRELDNSVVYATVNGVVREAGTVETGGTEDGFIIISGEQGLYVMGQIGELELESLHVDDVVTGMDYNTGATFTARVTEISLYPIAEDSYYSYGSSGAASSNYPFYAFIEESDADLSEDSFVQLTLPAESSGDGLYIYSYLIRTDQSGRDYVYIRGEDGKLHQRYVKTGMSYYGYETEVKNGLSLSDYIAFPHGKDVKEGADTVIADSLVDEY